MKPRPILLDTHAAIWTMESQALSAPASAAIEEAVATHAGAFVSPITAWEIGMLVARRRVALSAAPEAWFESLLGVGFQLAPLTIDILIASSFLPGSLHGDPADRILTATARAHGFRLMTRDRRLLDYAAEGHLQAIAC